MTEQQRSRRRILGYAGIGAGTAAGLMLGIASPAAADRDQDGRNQGHRRKVTAVELVGDGVTDNGPLIQAAYDAGQQVSFPDARGQYLIDTPVFFDEGVIMPTFELNAGGAELLAGANLPTTPSFGNGTTAFMFYPNTLRTALAGGVVTVSNATRATGSTGSFTSFVLRNADVRGQIADYGISFDNRCGVIHENITMTGGRVGSTWFSYAEPHVYREIYFRTAQSSDPAQVPGAFYVTGVQEGDGVYVESMKCSGSVGGVSLTLCRGAVINGNITSKLRFVNCEGITINGVHLEADIYPGFAPNVEIVNSTVTFSGGVLYRPRSSAANGTVVISDNHTERASQVDFHGTLFATLIRVLTADDPKPADLERGAHVWFESVSNGTQLSSTRVRGFGVKNKLASVGSANAGFWRPTAGLEVRSAVVAQDAALTSVAGLSQLATGDFDIQHGVGGWGVHAPGVQGLQVRRALPAPGTIGVGVTGQPVGYLESVPHQYVAAFRDASGAWTAPSAVAGATPETGSVRLLLQGAAAPAVVALWRSSTGDVGGAADGYVELTFSDARSFVMDTGARINGMTWRTSDIPAIPSANETAAGLLLYAEPPT